MQDELIKGLPGYAQGPRTHKVKDLFGLDGQQLLTEDTLVVMITEWVDACNGERSHVG